MQASRDAGVSQARDAPLLFVILVQPSRLGLHWKAIDEDISIAGLLAGRAAEWGRESARKGTLLEFLLASPLRGADLDLERQHDSPRDRPLRFARNDGRRWTRAPSFAVHDDDGFI